MSLPDRGDGHLLGERAGVEHHARALLGVLDRLAAGMFADVLAEQLDGAGIGYMRPRMALMVVVLPAPFEPMKPTTLPAGTVRSTFRRSKPS